jgi:DegV family protein with EDD domain
MGGGAVARIITDSTSDMGVALATQFGIQVVPLIVNLGGRAYQDGVDLDASQLFGLIDRLNTLPTTSAPSLGVFQEVFAGAEEGVFIGISSRLSGTVNQARSAVQEGGAPIRVVDSLTLSTGIALLALLAADLRDAGCGAAEIEREVLRARSRVRVSFVLETLKFLVMGGRCTALQSVMASVLAIRPVITCSPDGALGVKDRVRGNRRRSLNALVSDFRANADHIDLRRVFITHSGCPGDAAELAQELRAIAPMGELLITEAGTVISSHCGPGTIGVLYLLK